MYRFVRKSILRYCTRKLQFWKTWWAIKFQEYSRTGPKKAWLFDLEDWEDTEDTSLIPVLFEMDRLYPNMPRLEYVVYDPSWGQLEHNLHIFWDEAAVFSMNIQLFFLAKVGAIPICRLDSAQVFSLAATWTLNSFTWLLWTSGASPRWRVARCSCSVAMRGCWEGCHWQMPPWTRFWRIFPLANNLDPWRTIAGCTRGSWWSWRGCYVLAAARCCWPTNRIVRPCRRRWVTAGWWNTGGVSDSLWRWTPVSMSCGGAAVQEAPLRGWMVMAVLSNLVEPQGSLRGKMVQLGMSSGLNIALRWCHLAKVKARQTWGSWGSGSHGMVCHSTEFLFLLVLCTMHRMLQDYKCRREAPKVIQAKTSRWFESDNFP